MSTFLFVVTVRQVYTSTLLEYAREQLLEESFVSDSIMSESSFSHGSRRSHDSVGELISETDDAMPLSSPRAAPYLLHEEPNSSSDFLPPWRRLAAQEDPQNKSYTTEL